MLTLSHEDNPHSTQLAVIQSAHVHVVVSEEPVDCIQLYLLFALIGGES